jgi:hypothetical protein
MRRRFILLLGLLACPLGLAAVPESSPYGKPDIPGIVFVAAPMFDEKADGGQGVYQGAAHWRDGYVYPRSATYHRSERTLGPPRFGRELYALVPARPDGKLTRLIHLTSGAVFKPEPYFDGQKVLFAMRPDGEDWFHLYEINVDGAQLRQLTDGPFNDFAGVYLPDGRIVFCSDRTGYLEEYHEERTETLFVMNGDGSGIHQITFNPGTYFEPSVMKDGRILFSFWDAFHIDVPPFDKHETYLMTVHPDGTQERHLFGDGQYRFFGRERHSGVGLTQAREMPDGRILVQSEMGPSLIDLRAGLSVREALTPIFPGTTSIQTGGTTHRVHLSPLGTRSTAYPLQDGRILYSATLPGARDSAIYVCDPDVRQEQLVLNIPNHAEFDAVPVLVKRPRPARLPEMHQSGGRQPPGRLLKGLTSPAQRADTTRFLIVAGRVADNPKRAEALKRARFFRVIEAEYTGVTTSSHTNLETRILGVVPILPDGSCYFEAPADTPLFLDPLDAGGNRVLMEWNYPNTSVKIGTHYPATQLAYMTGRPGETRSCYGCHATQTDAVPNVSLLALKLGPVQIRRHSTDLEYRRNEPEAYRLRARLGDQQKYRRWLKSKDAEVRARGCMMLMYVQDANVACAAEVAALLKDEAVAVRRAAALALTRLATTTEEKALQQAGSDADWQVRFAAEAALEALHQTPDPDSLLRELKRPLPDLRAVRAAGKLRDAKAVKYLIPLLANHEQEYHAAEAAVALGRIGTKEAVAALWQALRRQVPQKQVHISRYLQHGPRPETYALLQGLILANAQLSLDDLYLLIALLPNAFMEKPRYEDRMRDESQRVLMPRRMLERAHLRRRAVDILLAALQGQQAKADPLYQQLLKGINLQRPFNEHGRPFPVVKQIGPEEALWLLNCLIEPAVDLDTDAKRQALEDLVVPLLTSQNQRERVDAAVLLGRTGFGPKTAEALLAEVLKPYPFPEIASIGKGMPDPQERDKAYLARSLAWHVADVAKLRPLADPRKMYRDIRYGLVRGLAKRGKADGLPLLVQMYCRDPIMLIRQQARYAIADIQDAYRLQGKDVPQVKLGEQLPLEALYPPLRARIASEGDSSFRGPNGGSFLASASGSQKRIAPKHVKKFLTPSHFRDLNFAQATGARYMMIADVEETRLAFAALAHQPGEAARQALLDALDTPYPYAHYLAAQALAKRGDKTAVPVLIKKLDAYVKAADTVGFWWCCEALGRLKAKEAVPTLARFAVADNPPGTFGPPGMATGYAAARALARIVADPQRPEVARLLVSDNVWLQAGALRGLAEAKAPRIEELLRQAAEEGSPALVRQEARVQLQRRAVKR